MDILLNRPPPTTWERLTSSPFLFLSRLLRVHAQAPQAKTQYQQDKIRIICISDTHNTHHSQAPLQDGDILIHSGDLTVSGTQRELDDVLSWLESQSHPHKFFIAGNHDTILAKHPDIHQYIAEKYSSLTYLEDSSAQVIIRGRTLRVYGSPWTPQHGNWVFQYPAIYPPWGSTSKRPTPEYQSTQIWSQIPPLTDILITHCPPLGHLDNNTSLNLEKVASGCRALLARLWFVRPKVHVFGHIHVGRGIEVVKWNKAQKAYEDILAQRTAWIGFVRLAWHRASMWFCRSSDEDGTLMVNAAAIGGIRDDQKLGAITIEI